MSDLPRSRRIVRFGEFEIDPAARELRRSGRRVPLQIQPFAVLEILVEHAGEVVSREHLRAKIWPSTVYVDFDHGLNAAMAYAIDPNAMRCAITESDLTGLGLYRDERKSPTFRKYGPQTRREFFVFMKARGGMPG